MVFYKQFYKHKTGKILMKVPESAPSTVNQELVPVRTVSDDSRQNPHSHILQTARANPRLLHV